MIRHLAICYILSSLIVCKNKCVTLFNFCVMMITKSTCGFIVISFTRCSLPLLLCLITECHIAKPRTFGGMHFPIIVEMV